MRAALARIGDGTGLTAGRDQRPQGDPGAGVVLTPYRHSARTADGDYAAVRRHGKVRTRLRAPQPRIRFLNDRRRSSINGAPSVGVGYARWRSATNGGSASADERYAAGGARQEIN
jgi:hypothetical protein